MDWFDDYLNALSDGQTVRSLPDNVTWGKRSAPSTQHKKMIFDAVATSEREMQLFFERKASELHEIEHHGHADAFGADPGSPHVEATSTPSTGVNSIAWQTVIQNADECPTCAGEYWTIFNPLHIKFNFANSDTPGCGDGDCTCTQTATAIATIQTGNAPAYIDFTDITGLGEAGGEGYENMNIYLDDVHIIQGTSGGDPIAPDDCMGASIVSVLVPGPYTFAANSTHTLRIEMDSGDASYHRDAFWDVVLDIPNIGTFPEDGLLAYWKLDEAYGTRIDATGNGYNLLTLGDVPNSVGKILSAAEFNPTESNLNFLGNDNLSAGPEFSVSTWVKFFTLGFFGNPQCVWGTGSPNVSSNPFNDVIAPNNPGDTTYFIQGIGPEEYNHLFYSLSDYIVGPAVEPNVWYHSVCTISPTENKMYINGELIQTLPYENFDQSFVGFGLSEFYGECGTGGCPMSGLIDETGVWNRVLTQEEVTALYNNGNALEYPYSRGEECLVTVNEYLCKTSYVNFGEVGLDLTLDERPAGEDDDYYEVALPFPVEFFGTEYNSIFVGTNGYITFGQGTDFIPYPGGQGDYDLLSEGLPFVAVAAGDDRLYQIWTTSPLLTANSDIFRVRYVGTYPFYDSTGFANLIYDFIFYRDNSTRIDVQIVGSPWAEAQTSPAFTPVISISDGNQILARYADAACQGFKITAANAPLFPYCDGLLGIKYDGYFDGDPAWFDTATPLLTSNKINFCGQPYENGTSWQWTGYFRATIADNYQFSGTSDDLMLMWVGSAAGAGNYTTENIFVSGDNNVDYESNYISLSAEQLLPMRIQWGHPIAPTYVGFTLYYNTSSNEGPGSSCNLANLVFNSVCYSEIATFVSDVEDNPITVTATSTTGHILISWSGNGANVLSGSFVAANNTPFPIPPAGGQTVTLQSCNLNRKQEGNLTEIIFDNDALIKTADVSQCTALTNLQLPSLGTGDAVLTSLDLTNNKKLTNVNIAANDFTEQGLNDLFDTLNNTAGSKTINVTDNPGTGDCDLSIATNKGWTTIPSGPVPPEPDSSDVACLTLAAGLYKKKYEGYFADDNAFFDSKLVSAINMGDVNKPYQILDIGTSVQQDWFDWGLIPAPQYDAPEAVGLPFPSVGKGVEYFGGGPIENSGTASVGPVLLSEEVTSQIDDTYSQAQGQNNKSLIIKGYFKPTVSGAYKFKLISDDASYLWLGDNAYDFNRTINNSVVSLPGTHGPAPAEGAFTMTADSYYALTVEFGNGPEGEGVLIFQYMPPGSDTWTSNLTGKLYYDVASKGLGVCPQLPNAPTIYYAQFGATDLNADIRAIANELHPLTGFEYRVNGGEWISFIAEQINPKIGAIYVTGLTQDVECNVDVRGVNSVGAGPSTTITGTPGYQLPAPPEFSDLNENDGQLDIEIYDNNEDPRTAQVSYEYRVDSGEWIPFAHNSPGNGPYSGFTISGLSNGTTYTIDIRSINPAGASETYLTVQGTPASVPDAPILYSVTNGLSANEITISYALGSSNGSPVTALTVIVRGEDNNVIGYTALPVGELLATVTIPGIAGQYINVVATAENSIGESGESNTISLQTTNIPPGAPTIVIADCPGTEPCQTLYIEFTQPTDGGSAITDYEYSIDDGETWSSMGRSDEGGFYAYGDAGNIAGQELFVRVRAVNDAGAGTPSALWPEFVCRSCIPSAPNVSVTNVGDCQLGLYYNEPDFANGTITHYEMSIDGGATWNNIGFNGLDEQYDFGYNQGSGTRLLSVSVRAVNASGAGDNSAPQSITLTACAE